MASPWHLEMQLLGKKRETRKSHLLRFVANFNIIFGNLITCPSPLSELCANGKVSFASLMPPNCWCLYCSCYVPLPFPFPFSFSIFSFRFHSAFRVCGSLPWHLHAALTVYNWLSDCPRTDLLGLCHSIFLSLSIPIPAIFQISSRTGTYFQSRSSVINWSRCGNRKREREKRS